MKKKQNKQTCNQQKVSKQGKSREILSITGRKATSRNQPRNDAAIKIDTGH